MASSSSSRRRISSVLVVGSSGTIGQHIISALAESRQSFQRVAIFTSPSTVDNKKDFIANLRKHDVEVIQGDLANDTDVKKAFEGFDAVVSALGRGALHLQTRLVDLYAGLPKLSSGYPRRFYPSEYGTDIRYDPVTSPHEKPHQNKLRTREHIEELAKQGKIEFTYVVTGPFLDTFIFARAGGKVGYNREHGTYGIVGSHNKEEQRIISGTTYKDTGRYVLSSLLTPDASANATLRVSSADAKPSDILSALEKLEGKSFRTSYTPLEDFKALEKEAWDKSDPAATVYTLSRIWYSGQSDFTVKPRALYFEDGKEVEKPELEEQLFKDVPKQNLEAVLRDLL